MQPERWSQIEGLFLEAMEMPPAERVRFLDKACNGDEALRREVNSLLENDAPNSPLLQQSLPSITDLRGGSGSSSPSNMEGRRIGVYRLVRLLGHGGMGSVHLAVRDDEQFHKEVAVKILKRGMDTDFMLGHFRQERQILANLEHPFIARLIDGGATDDGLPFFVLEYVDGLPITRYCTEKKLNLNERLRLFRLVCEAVQHAHQSLVIHRDLKPGNILITKEGIPKLLDFGIAKLIDPGVKPDSTLPTLTRRDMRMMTPAYASPEQARGSPINTATDIYSLGAVLYELLSGQLPHRFKRETPAEVERVICEVEPERPSVVAKSRRLEGDLDNIVLTAMRKEPQRRYASAVEFSEDIRRHMEGLPVAAQEDRWTYRAGKFIRRNRLGVATAALVVASLVVGIITTTVQARRAERRFQLARGLANSMVFDFNDQLERLPGSTSARASLVQTVVGYLDSLARDGVSDPALDLEIADAYRRVAAIEGHPLHANLGQTALSLSHYRKAIETYEKLVRLPDAARRATPGLILSHIEVSDIEIRTGNGAEAEKRLERASAIATEASARDRSAVTPQAWASLYFRQGEAATRRGDAAAALPYLQKALDVCREWAAADQGMAARSMLRAAYLRLEGAQLANGDLSGARASDETSLQGLEELLHQPNAALELQYDVIVAHRRLGDVLGGPDALNLGDREGALRHYRAAAAIGARMAAADPHEVRARDELQTSYRRIGAALIDLQPAEALTYYQKAFALAEALSESNIANLNSRRDLASSRLALGEALHRLGRSDEALGHMTGALEVMQQVVAAAPNQVFWLETVVRAHSDLGDVKLNLGDAAGAFEHYSQALAATGKLLDQAPDNLYFQRDRADAFEALGRYYVRVAARPEASGPARSERRALARSQFEQSHAIWQNWLRRKAAVPFASRRENRVAALLKNY
jgi:eukaryotic-like serine/threonine-protein kinase